MAGSACACSSSGPSPATWPLSPTRRSAAQNAAWVLDTTGMPWRSSSGFATPSVRKPPQEISSALGRRRLRADLRAESDDVSLALAAGLAEAEQAEALQRQHLEALAP